MEQEFHCHRCGHCCRHEGEVRLTDGEAEAIAETLGLDTPVFTDQFTRLREDRLGLSLTEHPDGSCIFLEGAPPSCKIQKAKPRQCREFPQAWRYEDWKTICPAAASLEL
jgi:Fe-S-cluster containining protein